MSRDKRHCVLFYLSRLLQGVKLAPGSKAERTVRLWPRGCEHTTPSRAARAQLRCLSRPQVCETVANSVRSDLQPYLRTLPGTGRGLHGLLGAVFPRIAQPGQCCTLGPLPISLYFCTHAGSWENCSSRHLSRCTLSGPGAGGGTGCLSQGTRTVPRVQELVCTAEKQSGGKCGFCFLAGASTREAGTGLLHREAQAWHCLEASGRNLLPAFPCHLLLAHPSVPCFTVTARIDAMAGIDYSLVAPPAATAQSLDVDLKVRGCPGKAGVG